MPDIILFLTKVCFKDNEGNLGEKWYMSEPAWKLFQERNELQREYNELTKKNIENAQRHTGEIARYNELTENQYVSAQKCVKDISHDPEAMKAAFMAMASMSSPQQKDPANWREDLNNTWLMDKSSDPNRWWPDEIVCDQCKQVISLTKEPESYVVRCPYCEHENIVRPLPTSMIP